MNGLPSAARVVVIGGGIGGCSVAYHLAALGVSDVVLLERSALSSGTTWHSTGNMETYRDDPLIFEMVRYAADIYPRLAAETGQEIGWRNVGRVTYTDREERWAAMRSLPELGRARGIELVLLSPADIQARLPIISTDELLGGVWVPSDARVNPTDAVMAFASAARARGAILRSDIPVTEIVVRDGAIQGVATASGNIACEAVVVAAGLWSADLVRSCEAHLPMHALEHQYLITQPLGIDRNLPLFLSFDDQLYGREEVGGIMVGSLDDEAIALSTHQLPQNFSFSLLSERWAQFEPYMATAMRRFPLLQTAGIKMLLNGPESFTPDGQMLLGPVPGVTGLYSACGFNSNGMALAPAAGRYIAEWIVEGEPSADVAPLDVRRFSAVQSADAYLRERVTEIPGYHCRMHAADSDYRTARDIRRSPLHGELAAAGAHYGSVMGWERPLWIARPESSNWLVSTQGEYRAALDGVLIVDRSADAKQLLTGTMPGAAPPVELVALSGKHGQVEVLARSIAWSDTSVLLSASPDQEMRLIEWLRRVSLPEGARSIDITAAHVMLELAGPRRRELVAAVAGSASLTSACSIGAVPVHICEDFSNESTLLIARSDTAAYVWRRLMAAGEPLGLRIGGHLVQEARRIARGVPAFGREATPSRLVRELGEGLSVRNLPGSPAAVPRNHRRRILAALSSPMPLLGFGSREVLLQHGNTVGELTSRVRLPGWPETLALGLLDPDKWDGSGVETVADGQRWLLMPRASAFCRI